MSITDDLSICDKGIVKLTFGGPVQFNLEGRVIPLTLPSTFKITLDI